MSGGFGDLGLLPEIVAAVEEEWSLPTDIQDEAIPLLLGGNDVMASAETGSGKTAAFALPILQLAIEHQETIASELCPTLPSPLIAGKEEGDSNPPIQLSKEDRHPYIAFHPEHNCRVQSQHPKEWAGCRASQGVSLLHPGAYVWEAHILESSTGFVRLGWSTADASLILGKDAYGFGYGGTGTKVSSNSYSEYPGHGGRAPFERGDVIACFLDVAEEGANAFRTKLSYAKNGISLGVAFEIVTMSGENSDTIKALFPTLCLRHAGCEVAFQGPMVYSYPGYEMPLQEFLNQEPTNRILNPRDGSAQQILAICAQQTKVRGPFAIVMEPTKELARQTHNYFVNLIKRAQLPIQADLLVAGHTLKSTRTQLSRGEVDIVVGTPPITASMVRKGALSTSNCLFLCLDEADNLVTTDFMESIKTVYSRLLAHQSMDYEGTSRFQVCFFSATLHDAKVQTLARSLCYKPMLVDLRGKTDSILPTTIHHVIVEVSPLESHWEADYVTDAVHREGKLDQPTDFSHLSGQEASSELVKLAKPKALIELIDKLQMDQVLVFCRTKLDCELLKQFLQRMEREGIVRMYSCRILSAAKSARERQMAIKEFYSGEVRILIGTDVAARGIDIRKLHFVVSMSLPDPCPSTYTHRCGRVGRAGHTGVAISLVSTVEERVWFCQRSQNPPCTDTSDYEEGGNCIWYSEPKLLRELETYLAKNGIDLVKTKWPFPTDVNIKTIVENRAPGVLKSGMHINVDLNKLSVFRSHANGVEITETEMQRKFWGLRKLFPKSAQAQAPQHD